MKCPNCGFDNLGIEKTCLNCGKILIRNNQNPSFTILIITILAFLVLALTLQFFSKKHGSVVSPEQQISESSTTNNIPVKETNNTFQEQENQSSFWEPTFDKEDWDESDFRFFETTDIKIHSQLMDIRRKIGDPFFIRTSKNDRYLISCTAEGIFVFDLINSELVYEYQIDFSKINFFQKFDLSFNIDSGSLIFPYEEGLGIWSLSTNKVQLIEKILFKGENLLKYKDFIFFTLSYDGKKVILLNRSDAIKLPKGLFIFDINSSSIEKHLPLEEFISLIPFSIRKLNGILSLSKDEILLYSSKGFVAKIDINSSVGVEIPLACAEKFVWFENNYGFSQGNFIAWEKSSAVGSETFDDSCNDLIINRDSDIIFNQQLTFPMGYGISFVHPSGYIENKDYLLSAQENIINIYKLGLFSSYNSQPTEVIYLPPYTRCEENSLIVSNNERFFICLDSFLIYEILYE